MSDPTTLPPVFLQKHQAMTLQDMRRRQGSQVFRGMDIDAGLAELSYESRSNILAAAAREDRLHMGQAVPALRFKLRSLGQVDLSHRFFDGHLLLELVSATACQAAHSRFPPSLEQLCSLKALKECSSTLRTLDLTGASIGPQCLHQLLSVCPQLEQLSLEGLYLTEQVFDLEEGLPELRVLSLSSCAGLADEGVVVALMRAAPNLTNLDISNSDISDKGVMHLALSTSNALEVLSVADLGQRFTQEHLSILTCRCLDLLELDISTTQAAVHLQCSQFMSLQKLQILMANMAPPIQSLMTAQTLSDFQSLASLQKVFIYRRIAGIELERLSPWNLKFSAIRARLQRLPDHAGFVCRQATLELDSPYPKMQLTHRLHYGGADPL